MNLNNLQSGSPTRKGRKRVGRGPGSGLGKTSGRGHKGQKARSGYSRPSGFEGGQMPLNRRLPKRGFHHEHRFPEGILNLDVLELRFEAGAVVTPEAALEAGLVNATKGGIKILGRGELTKKLYVKTHKISASARRKIEAVGGTVEILPRIGSDAETRGAKSRPAAEG